MNILEIQDINHILSLKDDLRQEKNHEAKFEFQVFIISSILNNLPKLTDNYSNTSFAKKTFDLSRIIKNRDKYYIESEIFIKKFYKRISRQNKNLSESDIIKCLFNSLDFKSYNHDDYLIKILALLIQRGQQILDDKEVMISMIKLLLKMNISSNINFENLKVEICSKDKESLMKKKTNKRSINKNLINTSVNLRHSRQNVVLNFIQDREIKSEFKIKINSNDKKAILTRNIKFDKDKWLRWKEKNLYFSNIITRLICKKVNSLKISKQFVYSKPIRSRILKSRHLEQNHLNKFIFEDNKKTDKIRDPKLVKRIYKKFKIKKIPCKIKNSLPTESNKKPKKQKQSFWNLKKSIFFWDGHQNISLVVKELIYLISSNFGCMIKPSELIIKNIQSRCFTKFEDKPNLIVLKLTVDPRFVPLINNLWRKGSPSKRFKFKVDLQRNYFITRFDENLGRDIDQEVVGFKKYPSHFNFSQANYCLGNKELSRGFWNKKILDYFSNGFRTD